MKTYNPSPAPRLSLPPTLPGDKPEDVEAQPLAANATELEARCRREFNNVLDVVREAAQRPNSTLTFEPQLWARVMCLGRMLFALWLCHADKVIMARLERGWVRGSRFFERRGSQSREIGTLFGKLQYRRGYAYCAEAERGYFPLDEAIGLTADAFTPLVVSHICRLATRMSYEAATVVFGWFLQWAPATRTVQELTMGLGGQAQKFAAQAPAPPPDDEGEVLVIQIDSKGIPTATKAELESRRGPRPPGPAEPSRRHRGRDKRSKQGPRPRLDPDDHSKNARMATLVVLYTLAQDPNSSAPRLLGPRNPRVHASFSPKRYAFQVARREAEKRGFGPDSGKRIQFVYDGDEDLETYRQQYFGDYPADHVIVTADIMHVLEYLWAAGSTLYPQDKDDRARWVGIQKARLLRSEGERVRQELRDRLAAVPKTGPGTKDKRKQLEATLRYLNTNAHRLDYKLVRDCDLELASGMVEGAVRNLIGLRFDQGGMRWIADRAEPLLQLRCIEINGQWDDFFSWLHRTIKRHDPDTPLRLRSRNPPPMPIVLPPHLAIAHAATRNPAKS